MQRILFLEKENPSLLILSPAFYSSIATDLQKINKNLKLKRTLKGKKACWNFMSVQQRISEEIETSKFFSPEIIKIISKFLSLDLFKKYLHSHQSTKTKFDSSF